MANLREKINNRMDALQHWMESDYHLKNPEAVTELVESISKFWPVMVEEDKDYVQAAQYAIEEQAKWGNPKDWN